MLFIDNKYTKWYYQIIESAKQNTPSGYTERHHIIPRSLGGLDNHNNLVSLTARQHFICHLLLTKMVTGSDLNKMWHALRFFTFRNSKTKRKFKITARVYEKIKLEQAKAASEDLTGLLFWNDGVTQIKSKTCPGKDFVRGKLVKIKRYWWNNGSENIFSPECPGIDFVRGRIPHPSCFESRLHTEETKIKIKEKRKLQTNNNGGSKKGVSKPQRKATCYVCGLTGGISNITRWHNDNCKQAQFDSGDIERHPVVDEVLKLYAE